MDIKQFTELSPFELKDYLIDVAQDSKGSLMLNAGRGNPNFFATLPRAAFFEWGQFALREAERSYSYLDAGVGGFPRKDGIENRLAAYVDRHERRPGCAFIKRAVSYVRDQLGLDEADFVYEMTEGILGIMYPVPDRMLQLSEQIVKKYLRREMSVNAPIKEEFNLFAVEGGTAAMTYLFDALEENFVINKGDKIALGLPIFTPYLEIPRLREYDLVEVNVLAEEEYAWQFSNDELDKLLDPDIKAFFLVNPSNPPSVKMTDERLDYLAKIVAKRPDIIIITDDVYGTFADGFKSIFAACPYNTALVYSFSKYFGSTGWRLGAIAMAENNVVDNIIAGLSPEKKKLLEHRYASISTAPSGIKFIDRLVAESRAVALNHTAGLAAPAQVQMTLFSLFALMDASGAYKNTVKTLIRRRLSAVYNELGVEAELDENSVEYYNLIEVSDIAEKLYGADFRKWLNGRLQPNEALFRLAQEAGTVLLPAAGFGTSDPGFRVSLANLNEYDYEKIGRAVRTLLGEYYEEFMGK
jgi:aspartate 4-decarboxylase